MRPAPGRRVRRAGAPAGSPDRPDAASDRERKPDRLFTDHPCCSVDTKTASTRRPCGREHWSTSFRWLDRRRLEEHETPDYSARAVRAALAACSKRDSLFAWTTNQPPRFDDFVVEARASFDCRERHRRSGSVLLCIDDRTSTIFSSPIELLPLSDMVFNGNPTPLIGLGGPIP